MGNWTLCEGTQWARKHHVSTTGFPNVERDGEVWREVIQEDFSPVPVCVTLLRLTLSVSLPKPWCCVTLRECRFELFLQISKTILAIQFLFKRMYCGWAPISCFFAFFSSLLFCIYFILFLQSSARSCRRKSRRRCAFTRWNRLWKYTKIVFQITVEKGVIYTQIIMFISQNVRLDMSRK